MRYFSAGIEEEVIVIGLDSGEDILSSIEEVIKKRDIKNGVVVSGVGSLAKAHYHIVKPGNEKPWKDSYIKKEGTIEVISLQGIIANGEPHLHISMSQEDEAFGGHLEKGCLVLTLVEIVIKKISGNMKRIIHEMDYGQICSDNN